MRYGVPLISRVPSKLALLRALSNGNKTSNRCLMLRRDELLTYVVDNVVVALVL